MNEQLRLNGGAGGTGGVELLVLALALALLLMLLASASVLTLLLALVLALGLTLASLKLVTAFLSPALYRPRVTGLPLLQPLGTPRYRRWQLVPARSWQEGGGGTGAGQLRGALMRDAGWQANNRCGMAGGTLGELGSARSLGCLPPPQPPALCPTSHAWYNL